jgi:glycosyltransferase involved in cell wall biosynthesis
MGEQFCPLDDGSWYPPPTLRGFRAVTTNSEGPTPRSLRVAHLTTVDMSLALLLGTELSVDVEAGHEVFGISAPGPYVERVAALGVTHVPVRTLTRSWAPASDLAAFRDLFTTIRSLDLDVLHTHNPKTGVMGRIAGRLAGVPVVVNTCHGLWARPEDSLAKRAFVYGLEGIAARFSDYELFQNAADEATLRPALRRGRHRVVGNGVDLVRFTPDPAGRRRVRAELGVADDELLVGTIGRRVREKGLEEFAEAAFALVDRATFVWVGPEDDTDAAAGTARTTGIRFVDERTDMPAVYSALDVFVLASYREGFSRAAMEAAACGVPMVLTDIRGCREVGDDGIHLRLVPPGDGRALASVVAELLEDPALRERLGAAARERALAHFDQRAVAAVSLRTYREVAQRKGLEAAARDDRVTVLHVLPADLDRGAQVYAGRLRDALADDPGQRHLVVSLFASAQAALRADVALGVPDGPLRRAGLDPRAVRALNHAIRTHRAAVVVAHGGEPLKYVVAATSGPRRAAAPATVYYKVGLSSDELARPARRSLYRGLAARVTRVVGVSRAVLDQVHQVLEVPRDALTLIPNGRDPDTFHPPADVGARTSPPRVLFVGQLEPGKQPGLFLDVIADLRSRGVDLEAAMVGDGPLRAGLAQRARTLGVELLGVRTDVPDLLRTASVLLLTSAAATEGMPGVLIEAGLSGLPVVSTDAAGVRDVVIDGETGFVCPSGRPEDLAHRVVELLEDAGRRTAMGDRARARCSAHLTVEATATQWRRLVADLTENAVPAAGQGPIL